jgi:hypothetical protein
MNGNAAAMAKRRGTIIAKSSGRIIGWGAYTTILLIPAGAWKWAWPATSILRCGKPDAIGGHADMPQRLLIRRP